MIKIGDRVSKQEKMNEPRIHGVIVSKYKSTQGVGFTPINLFDIKWDGFESISKGYMEQYLEKED